MKGRTILSIAFCLFSLFATTLSAQYCTSVGPSSTGDSNVESVALTGDAATAIAYTGCPGVANLEDLTATQTVSVTVNSPYTATVQFGTCGGNYGGAGEAWIDWNQNNTFDANESIGTWSGTPPTAAASMPFIVPATAVAGTTRMRVMQQEGGSNPLNPCGTFTWGSAVDFTVVVTGGAPITCPFPTSLFASGITAANALLNWTENGTATSWEIEWGTAGFAQGTGTTLVTGTNPHNLVGLGPLTSYDFYVRAICGPADTSFWIGPSNFTTPCATFMAPWTDDVEAHANSTALTNSQCWTASATTGYDWNIDGAGSTPSSNTGPSGANSGVKYFYTEASGAAVGAVAILTSPVVDISALTNPALEFYYHMTGNQMGTLNVEIYDGSSWVLVHSIVGEQHIAQADPFLQHLVDLSAFSGALQARFRAVSNGSFEGDIALDDIGFIEMPTCPQPTTLTASGITGTGANLGWTVVGSATAWQVEWGTAGFAQGSGTSAFTVTNPHTVGGLAPITSYDFYVRNVCGVGDTSSWSGPYTFTTACATYAAPWLDNVESHAATTLLTSSQCWTASATSGYDWNVDAAGSTPSSNTGPLGAQSGSRYFYTEASGAGIGAQALLSSPLIDVTPLTNPMLEFYYHMTGGQMGDLYVEVYDGSTWNTVDSLMGEQQTAQADPWIKRTTYLFGYTGTIQVRFRAIANGGFEGDIALDDINVLEGPSCPGATNALVTNITTNSADFSWVEFGTATSWNVEYGPTGFTLGTGTSVISGAPSLTNVPLAPGTTYDVYIQSICAPGDSSFWIGPSTFTTVCINFVAPFIESFDASSTPNCWSESGSESWLFSTNGSFAAVNAGDHTGNGGNYAWVDGSAPSGAAQSSVLISPNIDISALTVPFVSYWIYSHNADDPGYNTLLCEVYDGTTWLTVNTINTDQGDAWRQVGFSLAGFTLPSVIQIRFTITENSPGNSMFNDILIDDVEVKDAPNVSIDEMIGLQTTYCNESVDFDLVVSNNTVNTEVDVPWSVWSNGTIVASGTIPSMMPNSSDTISLSIGGVGPTGPNAMFDVYTTLPFDQVLSNDTMNASVGISYTGLSATLFDPIGCAGASNGSIVSNGHSGVGNYTYLWDATAASQTTATATGLAAGTYMVTVTDSIGCAASSSLTLVDAPALTVADTSADLGCNGNSTGWAMVTPTGGVPGYTYLWSNGQVTSQLMNADAGSYTVTVTDANGCEMVSSFTLNEPTAIVGSIADNANGSATASATGGAGGYTYQWDPAAANQTTATATGLASGNYYVVITDADGCSVVAFVTTTVLAVDELSNVSTLNLFPNPASNNVFVELDLVNKADVQIRLLNVTGQIVMTKALGETQSNKVELSTTKLPAGVYMMQFTIGSENVTKKLIITK